MKVRYATQADYRVLWELNQSEVPHVGTLTEAAFEKLAQSSVYLRIAETESKEFAGFILGFDESSNYSSMNFVWFKERYLFFFYVDRIVVHKKFRKRGVGRLLYDDCATRFKGSKPIITCEVNVLPPNPESLAFHKKIGFEQVGIREYEAGKKSVGMLVRKI